MDDLKTGWGEHFKTHSWLYLIMIGFFFAGIFISAKYYENKCNTHIIETFYNPESDLFVFEDNYSATELIRSGSYPYLLLDSEELAAPE